MFGSRKIVNLILVSSSSISALFLALNCSIPHQFISLMFTDDNSVPETVE